MKKNRSKGGELVKRRNKWRNEWRWRNEEKLIKWRNVEEWRYRSRTRKKRKRNRRRENLILVLLLWRFQNKVVMSCWPLALFFFLLYFCIFIVTSKASLLLSLPFLPFGFLCSLKLLSYLFFSDFHWTFYLFSSSSNSALSSNSTSSLIIPQPTVIKS